MTRNTHRPIYIGAKDPTKIIAMINASVTKLLERKMKLVVNREKSKVAITSAVKILGMTIVLGTAAISAQAMDRAMGTIKELTRRGTARPVERTIENFNRWYRGWSSYFEMTQYPYQFAKQEAHARRRIRTILIRNKKRKRYLARAREQAGVRRHTAQKVVYSNKGWWALSNTFPVTRMYPNRWFEQLGMHIKSDESHDHWFTVAERIQEFSK